MPVPEGIISTSTGPAEAVQEFISATSAEEADAIIDALIEASDAEEATEEYDLPELS